MRSKKGELNSVPLPLHLISFKIQGVMPILHSTYKLGDQFCRGAGETYDTDFPHTFSPMIGDDQPRQCLIGV